MKYLVFPLGYNPIIADGPPSEEERALGVGWTPRETSECREMEQRALKCRVRRPGQWSLELKDQSQ